MSAQMGTSIFATYTCMHYTYMGTGRESGNCVVRKLGMTFALRGGRHKQQPCVSPLVSKLSSPVQRGSNLSGFPRGETGGIYPYCTEQH